MPHRYLTCPIIIHPLDPNTMGEIVKKLLAIDDEPHVLRCLQRSLNSRGYDLHVTDDPNEGLRLLKNDSDIVLALLDIRMPQKNGFDIYKEALLYRKLPVLFVTAFSRSFDAGSEDIVLLWQDQFADGMTDILYKPFSLETLYEKVEGLIGAPDETPGENT